METILNLQNEMVEQDQEQDIIRNKPKPVRRCGFCRRTGHQINQCEDPEIDEKHQALIDAANYSLAYQPSNAFLLIRLRTMHLSILKMVALKFGIGGIRGCVEDVRKKIEDTLVEILYTVPKQIDGHAETARHNLQQSANGLETINELLVEIFTETIHQSLSHTHHMRDALLHTMQPTCPREQRIYDALQIPILIRERERTFRIVQGERVRYDLARGRLARARIDYNRINDTYKEVLARTPIVPPKFNVTTKTEATAEIAENVDCPICYETQTPQNMTSTNCAHDFCQSCIVKTFEIAQIATNNSAKIPKCAMCRTVITSIAFKTNEHMNTFGQRFCHDYVVQPEVIEEVTFVIDRTGDQNIAVNNAL